MFVRPLKDEEMPREILDVLQERFKGRNIPTAYRILARSPRLVMKFINFRDEVMKGGKIDPVLKEKIALKVSEINECSPCYVSHKRKLEVLNASESAESEREKVALDFVEAAVLNRGKVNDDAFNELLRHFDEDEVLEIALVVSLFMFLNTFNNLLVK